MEAAETIEAGHGRRSIDTVRELRPDLDAESENAFIEHLEITDNDGLVILPGVKAFLNALPDGRWTVVTSATRKLALSRLAAGGIPLRASLVSGDDVTIGKPDPAAYRAGAAALGLAPQECLVIEDAPSGVASGKAAGCRVLAVAEKVKWASLADADYRVESLADVRVGVRGDEIRLKFKCGVVV